MNPLDLGILKTKFFSSDPDADLNGDGSVNPIDLGIMKEFFFIAPGPGAIPDDGVTYLHRDHLGSIISITDELGKVVAARAYDAWGKRRAPEGASLPDTMFYTPRGYTGREHLPHLGLIHMNGRVYDPTIARFISPDPTVPDPTNLQAFNRYAYVYGRPTTHTDPSGFDTVHMHNMRRHISPGAGSYNIQQPNNPNNPTSRGSGGYVMAALGTMGYFAPQGQIGIAPMDGGARDTALSAGNTTALQSTSTSTRAVSAADSSQTVEAASLQDLLSAKYSPEQPFYHRYGGPGEGDWAICTSDQPFCTSQRGYDALLHFAFPGQDNSQPARNYQIYEIRFAGLSAGHIQVRLEPESFSVFNVTRPDHDLHDGYVRRSVVWQGNTLLLRTFGEGNNRNFVRWAQNVAVWRPGFNQYNYELRYHLIQTWLGEQQ